MTIVNKISYCIVLILLAISACNIDVNQSQVTLYNLDTANANPPIDSFSSPYTVLDSSVILYQGPVDRDLWKDEQTIFIE